MNIQKIISGSLPASTMLNIKVGAVKGKILLGKIREFSEELQSQLSFLSVEYASTYGREV